MRDRRRASRDPEASVSEWVELVKRTSLKPFTENVGESWKWVGREYAGRKLGIPGGDS